MEEIRLTTWDVETLVNDWRNHHLPTGESRISKPSTAGMGQNLPENLLRNHHLDNLDHMAQGIGQGCTPIPTNVGPLWELPI